MIPGKRNCLFFPFRLGPVTCRLISACRSPGGIDRCYFFASFDCFASGDGDPVANLFSFPAPWWAKEMSSWTEVDSSPFPEKATMGTYMTNQ